MISVVAICQHAKILHNYWIYYPPCRESWEQKNWCLWTVVLEKSLESPLDCKEIQPVHPKGDQSWVFIGETNEAEASILWPPDAERWLIWKDPDAGKGGEGDDRGWDGLDGIIDTMDMGLGGFHELVMDRRARHAVVHGVTESDMTEWLKTDPPYTFHTCGLFSLLLKFVPLISITYFFFISGNHLFVLYNCFCCYICSFVFLDSTRMWNHRVFVYFFMTYFT